MLYWQEAGAWRGASRLGGGGGERGAGSCVGEPSEGGGGGGQGEGRAG